MVDHRHGHRRLAGRHGLGAGLQPVASTAAGRRLVTRSWCPSGSHEVYALDLVTDAFGTATLRNQTTDGRIAGRASAATWSAYGPSPERLPRRQRSGGRPGRDTDSRLAQSNSMHSVITITKPIGGAWRPRGPSDDDVDSSLPSRSTRTGGGGPASAVGPNFVPPAPLGRRHLDRARPVSRSVTSRRPTWSSTRRATPRGPARERPGRRWWSSGPEPVTVRAWPRRSDASSVGPTWGPRRTERPSGRCTRLRSPGRRCARASSRPGRSAASGTCARCSAPRRWR